MMGDQAEVRAECADIVQRAIEKLRQVYAGKKTVVVGGSADLLEGEAGGRS